MFIQLAKKISQKDADRLRNAKQAINSMAAFIDFKYLFEAANTEQSPLALQTKDCKFNTVNVIRGTTIGYYIPSQFRIDLDNGIIGCTRVDERKRSKFPKGLIFFLHGRASP